MRFKNKPLWHPISDPNELHNWQILLLFNVNRTITWVITKFGFAVNFKNSKTQNNTK